MDSAESFDVVSLNLLLDKTRTKARLIQPQHARIAAHIRALSALPVELDVVGLQEVHVTEHRHNGIKIAQALGFTDSHWYNHNTSKRSGEYIGMFGSRATNVEAFDVGHDKKAIIARIGNAAVVNIHSRNEKFGPMRTHQANALIEQVSDIESVAIIGDSNALPLEKSRRVLHKAGFVSAFKLAGLPNPPTHPTPNYRNIFYSERQQRLVPRGASIDVVYVRNLDVDRDVIGTFVSDTDHYGLYARLSMPANN